MRTSTRCNRGGPQWRTRIAGSVKVLLTLCLLYFITPNLSAQGGATTCPTCPAFTGTIRVDGNPCDWRSGNIALVNPLVFTYKADPFGNGVNDTSFTEGSKDFMTAAQLTWTFGQTKAKNDIANAAVAIVGDTLYFAGDRTSNNGDAQIGFWFYLGGTAPAPNTHFAPEHQVGDILVLADFTGGGGTANVTTYRWVGTGGSVGGGTLEPFNCNGAVVAENNDGATRVPFEGNFDQPCYEQNEFYEGKIPLTCIAGATGNVCFSSFLLETRSSQEITASLDDFVSGAFTVAPTAVLTGGTITCANPTVTLSTAGSSTGTLVITGPAPATTVVSGPVTAGGVYTLRITNAVGCTASATASVSVNNTAPTAVLTGGTITCTNPTVTLSTTGSSSGAGFTSVIRGPSPATTVVGGPVSAGGVYTLTVTNTTNGCTATATASVSMNNTAPTAVLTGGTITCTNPTVTLSTTGSSSGAGFTSVITGPSPATTVVGGPVSAGGVYTLTVTNTGNGCTATATASVSVNTTAPTAVLAGGTITCTNPTVTLSTTGSSSGAGFTSVITGPSPATTVVGGPVSAGGLYTLTVTNTTNGCTATATASVSVNNTPPTAVLTGGTITCANPSVTLSTAGSSSGAGFTSVITGPSPATTVVGGPVSAGGVYTLTVTNTGNGCTATATASVSVNNAALTAVLTGGTITCTNPSVTLSTAGSSSGAGITAVIRGPSPATTVVGGPVTVGGLYTLTVSNATTGCSATATASVSVNNTAPNASAVGATITCASPCVPLTGMSTTPGVTFTWNGPGGPIGFNPITVCVGGPYTLTVTNPINGCTTMVPVFVATDITPPTAALAGGTITCANPSVTLSTAGSSSGAGFTSVIRGPSPATTVVGGPVSAGGLYTLTVTNTTNGCTATATASVSVNNTAVTAVLTGGTITCTNTSVTLSTAGSSSGAGITQTITGPAPATTVVGGPVTVGGLYTLTVSNATTGCSATATASVSVNNTAPTAVLAGGTITCANPSVTLNTAGSSSGAGFTSVIRGPSPATTVVGGPVTVGGLYTLTVTNNTNGCTATATASVSVNTTAPTAVLTGGTITCTNTSVTLSTAGSSSGAGFTSVITGPAPATTVVGGPVTVGGLYTLTVTNTGNGCTATATASVSVNNTGVTAALQGGTITCTNTSVTLGTAGSSSGVGITAVITGPSPATTVVGGAVTVGGLYTLRVTNTSSGCTATATASVSVNTTAPIAMATGGQITCGNTTVNISGAGSSTGAGFTYLWSGPGTITNGTTLTATVNAVGTYTLRVTNTANGCTATATASVTKQNCNILVCSYTQGFWGNKNGLALMLSSGILNTPITIGVAGHSVIIPAHSETLVNDMMPGGSTPTGLLAGNFTVGTNAFNSSYLTKQGKINNVLLSQTITLTLNSRLNSGLLATIPLTACMLIDDSTHYFDQDILTYMAAHGYPATVAGLLQLANAILGGSVAAGVGGAPSYSEINGAVTWVNEAFDECRMFGGACAAPVAMAGNVRTTQAAIATTTQVDGLQVSAYPNPFNEVVKFTIQSKVSGKAQLEVYNMLGQKVKTVYNGFIQANKAQVVEFRAGAAAHQSLLYILKIGDNQVTGKLLNSRE